MAPTIAEEIAEIRAAIQAQGGTIFTMTDDPDPDEAIELETTVKEFVDAGFTLGGGVFYMHVEFEESDEDDADAPVVDVDAPVAVTASFLREGRFHTYYRADEAWEARMAEMIEAEGDEHDHDHEHEIDLEDADPDDLAADMIDFANERGLELRRDVNKVITEYWKTVDVDADELTDEERRVVMKANAVVRMAAKRSG